MQVGLVLAGGASTRMGQDKALLQWQGRSLLAQAVERLRAAGVDQVLISGRPFGDLPWVADERPGAGPLAGIRRGFEWLRQNGTGQQDRLLVLPVDMPCLGVEPLSRLLLEAPSQAGVLHYEGEVFPCLLSSRPGLDQFLDQVLVPTLEGGKQKQASMRELFAFLGARAIARTGLSPDAFVNVNHPREWEWLLHRHGQGAVADESE